MPLAALAGVVPRYPGCTCEKGLEREVVECGVGLYPCKAATSSVVVNAGGRGTCSRRNGEMLSGGLGNPSAFEGRVVVPVRI
jgi:hypothetical protein